MGKLVRRMTLVIMLIPMSITKAETLQKQAEFWEQRAFYCRGKDTGFPSKKTVNDPEGCDDGDMTLFNGLLCASGDSRGCEAVMSARGDDGRWWRSPRRIGRERDWNKADDQSSFSHDQALGVVAYVVATGDVTGFIDWLNWIQNNKNKLKPAQIKKVAEKEIKKLNWPSWQVDIATEFIANALPERLSYCKDDLDAICTLRPGDCALLNRTAEHLGVPMTICDNYLFYNDIVRILSAVGLEIPEVLAVANSYANNAGYPIHLAGVQVFLLKRMHTDPLKDIIHEAAAKRVQEREKRNPFFLFLSAGPTDGVREMVRKHCPNSDRLPLKEPYQWAWERTDSEEAWRDSMYWDCIFMAKLLN